jgi:hypothetical protein
MAPEGRQSPDPETQTGAQIGKPASGKNEQSKDKDYPNKEDQLKVRGKSPRAETVGQLRDHC